MRVHSKNNAVVPLDQMADGDIAEVVVWGNMTDMQGEIIQRYGQVAVILGKRSGLCYDTIFDLKDFSRYQVIIQPKGTLLEI